MVANFDMTGDHLTAELLEQNFRALFGRAQDLCSRLRLGRVPSMDARSDWVIPVM